MTEARVAAGAIVVEIGVREDYMIRMVPGARYHRRADKHLDREHWTVPLSWASCVTLRGVFGDRLSVGEDLFEWAREERRRRIDPAMSVRDLLEPDGKMIVYDWMQGWLRPYQVTGAYFMMLAESAILADGMRVGKMRQMIAALRLLDARPSLVVCPNSVKLDWRKRILEAWPEARPVVVRGTPKQRRDAIESVREGDAGIAVINWESLRMFTRLTGYGSQVRLARCRGCGGGDDKITPGRCEVHERELNAVEWRAVVADEGHRAKDPRSKQTRALWAVSKNAPHRFVTTGTPILNSPEDLWALGRFVAPEEWPSKTAFIERYAFTGWNPFGGLEVLGLREDRKTELFSFVDPRFLRRPRSVAMPWIKEKVPDPRTVELVPKQRKAYDQMAKRMIAELDGGEAVVTNPLVKLTRLRQFASAYARIEEIECPRCKGDTPPREDPESCDKCKGRGTVEKVTMQEPSCKVDALMDVADELGEKQAAVFAESKQLIDLAETRLKKAGYKVGRVTGDENDLERDRAVTDFQRGDIQFALLTIGAGGEGITLDRADHVVFLERSWSAAKNEQAEDRIIGQEEGAAPTVVIITAEDTIEQRVDEVLDEKAGIIEEVVRDAQTIRRLLGEPTGEAGGNEGET